MFFVSSDNCSGKAMSNLTTRSPLDDGFLDTGRPMPLSFLTVVGLMIFRDKSRSIFLPSIVGICTWVPQSASFNGTLHVKTMFSPSLVNTGWGLSLITKAISAGIFPGTWSPSFSNVTLVPAFQPGFKSIVSTLLSLATLPSSLWMFLLIFIFFWPPVAISSRETNSSLSMVFSLIFLFRLLPLVFPSPAMRSAISIGSSWWCIPLLLGPPVKNEAKGLDDP